MLYKVQVKVCSGSTRTFSCDNPNEVMWVGRGVNWGAMIDPAIPTQQCTLSPLDCIINSPTDPLVNVSA